jgi:hypothetical protein
LDLTGPLTLLVWAKYEPTDVWYPALLGKGYELTGTYGLHIRPGGTVWFELDAPDGARHIYNPTDRCLAPGQWCWLAPAALYTTADAARTYLHTIIGDVVEPERIDTYLDRAPEMLSFVLQNTPREMCWGPGYSDYYPETPGGRPGGRSIEPKPFDAKKLGPDMSGLEPAYGKVPLNVVVMQQDYVRLNQLKRHPRGVLRSLKVGVRTVWAGMRGKNLVGMGRALIAPLRIGLQDAGAMSVDASTVVRKEA